MKPSPPKLPKPLRFSQQTLCPKVNWLPSPYAKQVGDWLKTRREQLRMTLREAAKKGDCSDAWLSQLENARINIWRTRVDHLYRILASYQLDMVTLLKLLRVLKDN